MSKSPHRIARVPIDRHHGESSHPTMGHQILARIGGSFATLRRSLLLRQSFSQPRSSGRWDAMCFGFAARTWSSRFARAAVSGVAEYGCQCNPTARSQLVSPSPGARGRSSAPSSLVCVVASPSASSLGDLLLFILLTVRARHVRAHRFETGGDLLAVNLSGSHRSPSMTRTVRTMWTVLVILLVAWVVLSVVGFVFQGLLWLAIIGIVLFVGTLVFGVLRQRAKRMPA